MQSNNPEHTSDQVLNLAERGLLEEGALAQSALPLQIDQTKNYSDDILSAKDGQTENALAKN